MSTPYDSMLANLKQPVDITPEQLSGLLNSSDPLALSSNSGATKAQQDFYAQSSIIELYNVDKEKFKNLSILLAAKKEVSNIADNTEKTKQFKTVLQEGMKKAGFSEQFTAILPTPIPTNKLRPPAKEIIETEEKYNKELRHLKNGFFLKLADDKKLSKNADVQRMIALSKTLDPLTQVSDDLLKAFKGATENPENADLKISGVLKQYAPSLRCYADYTNAFDELSKIADRLKSNKDYQNFSKAFQGESLSQNLTPEGFFIKPVQRVMKYPLLLAALSKGSDESTEKTINEAKAEVEKVLGQVNNQNRKEEEENKKTAKDTPKPAEPIAKAQTRQEKAQADFEQRGLQITASILLQLDRKMQKEFNTPPSYNDIFQSNLSPAEQQQAILDRSDKLNKMNEAAGIYALPLNKQNELRANNLAELQKEFLKKQGLTITPTPVVKAAWEVPEVEKVLNQVNNQNRKEEELDDNEANKLKEDKRLDIDDKEDQTNEPNNPLISIPTENQKKRPTPKISLDNVSPDENLNNKKNDEPSDKKYARKLSEPRIPTNWDEFWKYFWKMVAGLLQGALGAICYAAGKAVNLIGKVSGSEKLINAGKSLMSFGKLAMTPDNFEPIDITPKAEKPVADRNMLERLNDATNDLQQLNKNQVGEKQLTPAYNEYRESAAGINQIGKELEAKVEADKKSTPEQPKNETPIRPKPPNH